MHAGFPSCVRSLALVVYGLCLVTGCASRTPEYLLNDAYALRFGVDTRVEADALERQLVGAGRKVVARVDGSSFSALGLLDETSDGTGVRIVTERGIALAFDAGAAHGYSGIRLSLLPARFHGDVNDDGREEVFVVGEEAALNRRCIQGYRVLGRGDLQTLKLKGPLWPDPLCVETLSDIDGDGQPEGLLRIRLWDLARYGPPSIPLPVWIEEEGFVWRRADPALTVYLAAMRARLEAQLATARASQDVEEAYRLAVELALCLHFAGERETEQLAALDAASAGQHSTASLERSYADARAYIRAGWQSETPADDDPDEEIIVPETAAPTSMTPESSTLTLP